MSIELNLISFEQLATTLFVISDMYAFASGNQAAKAEIENIQNSSSFGKSSSGKASSGQPSFAMRSAQLAWSATWYSAAAYAILTTVAAIRTNILEEKVRTGTSKASIAPSEIITINFLIALIAAVNRLPALEQRIREGQTPVIL